MVHDVETVARQLGHQRLDGLWYRVRPDIPYDGPARTIAARTHAPATDHQGSRASLHLVYRPRPIFTQRVERVHPVRQKLAARLASGAVVRLVLCIHDALDRRSADRARLAVSAVDGHAIAKRRDFFREPLAYVFPQPGSPMQLSVSRVAL